MHKPPIITFTMVTVLLAVLSVGILVLLFASNNTGITSSSHDMTATAQMAQLLIIRLTACTSATYDIEQPEMMSQVQQVLGDNVQVMVRYVGVGIPNRPADPRCGYYGSLTVEVAAEVESLDDLDALGAMVLSIHDGICVLLETRDELPAPLQEITISFTTEDEQRQLVTTFDDIVTARDQGLTGAELIAALGGLR